MTLLILYLLTLLDGLLCGLRTSMGQSAWIGKRGYYTRAAIGGIVGAQIVSTLALAALIVAALESCCGFSCRMRVLSCSILDYACFLRLMFAAPPACLCWDR
jgi:hypothetical protein